MSQLHKLYLKIKNNPRNVSFEDIDLLLRRVGGFNMRNKGSSHYNYYHPDLVDIITMPKNKPIKSPYIIKALSAIETVNETFIKECEEE